jgi:ribonuclease Z
MHFHSTQDKTESLILQNSDIQAFSFPLNHRIPCTGFRFNEREGLPRMNKEKIKHLNIPPIYFPLIKQGEYYRSPTGEVYTSEELTLPPRATRSYAYCSDTLYSDSYFHAIKNLDLLYHEATFMNDMSDRALETHHTTAAQAAQVAKNVNAKKLIIGHFSARYRDLDPLLLEGRNGFKETYLAIEGDKYSIEIEEE